MKNSLWHEHVLPFTLLLGLLAATTLAGDYLLHRFNLVWVGRYMGIPGTVLIVGSLYYSLRKRKYVASGDPKSLLKMHEFSAWLGSLMVLIHAGVHFNAILPWLATIAMGVNVISGMVGKMLLKRSRQHVQGEREKFQLRGLSKTEVEQSVFWDSVALGAMTQWRKVHIPIFIVFAVLALGHIFSIFLFWGWV
ncbi:hypothetical protein [Rhodoferax ferrireducens]|uniref:hypothetical protein n=1 Tax=Rhodoferax ferrireducens TaxID=192843 RepID=UPI000E0DF06F|nr:hypothetical protein [Rhodoferax ferrireducens]